MDDAIDTPTRENAERCALSRALLSDWIDGDLPAGVARAVGQHVDACRPCRLLAVSLRGVVADVARLAGAPSEHPGQERQPGLHPFGLDSASNRVR